MTASASAARCDPANLLPLFSPGQVVGLYQGTQWIDWSCPPAGVEILSCDPPGRLWQVDRHLYHLVIDADGAPACLAPFLECLTAVSRGVALVSSRLGTLLQRAARIVAPPVYPQRTSGPFRSRSSGAVLVFRETTLRVAERAQILDSATLSVALADPGRAVDVLRLSFPSLQVERSLLHLPLRGHHAEEVLGRLRQEGVHVQRSAVWFRLLQSCPLRIEGLRD
jgi:hypothetical protein